MPSKQRPTPPDRDGEAEDRASGMADGPQGDGVRPDSAALLARSPSALSLVRLSRRSGFPPGGEALYRYIARDLELGGGHEFVIVPCGSGVTTRFLARLTGATGSGVDPNADLIRQAVTAAKAEGLADGAHFEPGDPEDLPYKDEVFDAAIGDIGLASTRDPGAAVRELVRVTRPMGTVLLIQLSWSGNVEPEQRDAVVEYLGLRPLLLVEWKRLLRESGVVDLAVEDWTHSALSIRRPFGLAGLADSVPFLHHVAAVGRGWQRWGWRGMWRLYSLGSATRSIMGAQRLLTLSMIRGTRWPDRPPADGPRRHDER